MVDIFKYDPNTNCTIVKCGVKNCKLCKILITDPAFESGLTNTKYTAQGHANMTCKTSNVVYGIECNLCGLVYIGETLQPLHDRISGHRSDINTCKRQLLYKHFNQKDHSVLSMKVRIIEKIIHSSNDEKLSTHYRRQREEYWIRKLGTAFPYGCNDKIDSIGNLTSPKCSSVNVLGLFNKTSRRKRSHGHRHYTPPIIHDVSFDKLLPYVQKPLGLHYIRTKLFITTT